jgi:PAS domain S-box-containing protein/putative nucleotidyltransferase with HDIG domain
MAVTLREPTTFGACPMNAELRSSMATEQSVERVEAPDNSQQRHAELFDAIPIGFAYCRLLYDAEGRPNDWLYLHVNPAFGHVTGLRDVVGKRATVVFPTIAEENPELFDLCGSVVESGEPLAFESDFTPLHLWLHVFLLRPEPGHFAALLTDVTAARTAEAALRHNETWLEAILDSTADGILAVDDTGRVVKTNRRFAEMWRIPDVLLAAGDDAALLAFVLDQLCEPETFLEKVQSLYGSDIIDVDTLRFKDGRVFERHSAATLQGSTVSGRVWSFSDITERALAERTLRQSEAKFRSLVENIEDVVLRYDLNLRFTYVSPAISVALGPQPDDLLGKTHLEAGFSPAHSALFDDALRQALETRLPVELEFSLLGLQGEVFSQTRVFPELDSSGRPISVVSVSRDVTVQKRTSAALQERERMLSTLMGNLPGMAYRCAKDERWTMEFVSDGCEALTGYPPEALLGNAMLSFADLMHPDDIATERQETEAAIARDEPWTTTYRITTAAGHLIWVWERGSALKDADGTVLALEGFVHEITKEHEAEVRLQAASDEWRRTFDAMGDSVAVFNDEGRLLRCNVATTQLTRLDFDDLIGRRCYEVFHGTRDYHPQCPMQRAFISGHPETSILEQDDRWLRVTFEPDFDVAGRLCGGVHVITEVSELKAAEHRARESLTRLARTTDGVIAALSRSVEVRDAYTAGHQRRVSELSAAIALELGLSAEVVRRVRVAGMLHDVGKIIIPAEILAKPGRLAHTEFALIKEHPKAAYEILESIEFDFPAADIVVQHHERLDGTGYPCGLEGEEILPEARIIAVADVIEAMISHRPYRAALPIDDAVAEIGDGAGRRYDAAACRAAIHLLTAKGFEFST